MEQRNISCQNNVAFTNFTTNSKERTNQKENTKSSKPYYSRKYKEVVQLQVQKIVQEKFMTKTTTTKYQLLLSH
jgi:hypothetical protein